MSTPWPPSPSGNYLRRAMLGFIEKMEEHMKPVSKFSVVMLREVTRY
jgi:hypothetical protein